jgi:multidrug resistance efflux pump
MTPSEPPVPSPGTPSLGERVRSLRLGDTRDQRPARWQYLPWALVVALAVATGLLGYRAYRISGTADPDAVRQAALELAKKNVGKPSDSDGSGTPGTPGSSTSSEEVVLQSKGYVVPFSLIQVSPRVGGQLIKINERFREGERFAKGDFLAQIDPKEYLYERDQMTAASQAAYRRYLDLKENAEEEVLQAEADLEEVKNSSQQWKLEMDRNMKLARGNAVAIRELEQAQYSYQAMSAKQRRLESYLRMIKKDNGRLQLRIQAAEQEWKQAEERAKSAQMRLDWCRLEAPVNGIILTKKAELHNLVNPSAFSSGISASLCEMADLTKVEIDLSIQERDVALLRQGQACLIMPEAFQKHKPFLDKHPKGYEGYISRLMPTADRAKGAVPVRVWVKGISAEEAGVYLKPDMGALVSFLNMDDPEAKNAGAK